MDKKKIAVVVVLQFLLDISLIAYAFSLYVGDQGKIGIYSSWATLFFASGSLMFSKRKSESGNKALDIWSNTNAILFALMAIFEIVKLIIS